METFQQGGEQVPEHPVIQAIRTAVEEIADAEHMPNMYKEVRIRVESVLNVLQSGKMINPGATLPPERVSDIAYYLIQRFHPVDGVKPGREHVLEIFGLAGYINSLAKSE